MSISMSAMVATEQLVNEGAAHLVCPGRKISSALVFTQNLLGEVDDEVCRTYVVQVTPGQY